MKDKAPRLFSDLTKQNDWDGLIEEIRQKECQMAAIDIIWRDQRYDEECAAAEDRHQGALLNLKTIGANIAELQKAVENANTDHDQRELLAWLCDVDPSPMYNAARNKHKDGTGEWLIKDNAEFKAWVQNPRSLLWLHGKELDGQRERLMKTLHRKETDIDASLRGYLSEPEKMEIDLCTHRSEIEKDIDKYINITLADANYNSWPDDIKAEVTRILIEKSDGMPRFQYVRCQFEALQKLRSVGEIHRALDDLPKGLDETYKRMLHIIDNQYRKQVANPLKWLAFSVETLSIDELAEIFVMHPDDDDVIGDKLFNTQDILTYFSGLIVVERQKSLDLPGFLIDETSITGQVHLAHFSIKKYLTSSRVRNDLPEERLLLDHGADVNALGGEHGTALQAVCSDFSKTPLVQLLLDHGANVNALGGRCATALQATSQFLLDRGANMNIEGGEYGTPLQAACAGGQGRHLVQSLLDRGADVNAAGGNHGTALQIARAGSWQRSDDDDIEVTRILLEYGANARVHGGEHGSPLHSAAKRCLNSLAQQLLDHGPEINHIDGKLGSALHCALFPQGPQELDWRGLKERESAASLMKWSTAMIRLLLERGADVNLSGGEYGFPLQAACAIVYDYDAQLEGGFCTIHSRRNNFFLRNTRPQAFFPIMVNERVKTLLDECTEIDINAHGGVFGTALQAAAYSVHLRTMADFSLRRLPEWAPQSKVIMGWPGLHAVLKNHPQRLAVATKEVSEVATAIANYQPVTVVVGSERYEEAEAYFSSFETPFPITLHRVAGGSMDVWLRDFAPTFVVKEGPGRDRSLVGLDWNFNGWGNKHLTPTTEVFTETFLQESQIERIETSIITEGGSLETDGDGTILITESSIVNDNRNPGKSREDIEIELKRTLGVEKANEVEEGEWTAVYKEALDILSHETDAKGRRFSIIEVEEPDPALLPPDDGFEGDPAVRSYVNYFLVNEGIILSQFGDEIHDIAAYNTIQALIGNERTVFPVQINELPRLGGGIHCITLDILQFPIIKASCNE
ncbi:porphyromonas-type peptidyl-arginine deiminase [Trichoderma arundinaceum]|uniref:Porphyromonas-type peptidyl-arginine deiminase n=1 Tax=Trichoderma arundinaceum TaxID=490622 RepID=A0A395NDI5_TRIAR|nr:porphyromonas-type peptidyl-arginine deiminase [Trichoderma arundinaceum]